MIMTRSHPVGMVVAAIMHAAVANAGPLEQNAEPHREGQLRRVEATGTVAHSSGSRSAAIDAAFASAVTSAAKALIPAHTHLQHAAVIRDAIARHARRYVARYQMLREGYQGEHYRVALIVWIYNAKLRTALVERGVPLAATLRYVAPVQIAMHPRPKLALLVRNGVGDVMYVNFGRHQTADDPVAEAAANELRALGFELVETSTEVSFVIDARPKVNALSDAAAFQMAQSAGAGAAIVIDARVGDVTPVRGTNQHGAEAEAEIRLIGVKQGTSSRIATERTRAAAYGMTRDSAIRSAATLLGSRVVGAAAIALRTAWPKPLVAPGRVVLDLRGAPWSVTRTIWNAMANSPVVAKVIPRLMLHGRFVLEVVTRATADELLRFTSEMLSDKVGMTFTTRSPSVLLLEVNRPPVPAAELGT